MIPSENGRRIEYEFVALPACALFQEDPLTPGELRLLAYLIHVHRVTHQDLLALGDDEILNGRRGPDGERLDGGCGLKSANTLKDARDRLEGRQWLLCREGARRGNATERAYTVRFERFAEPISQLSKIDSQLSKIDSQRACDYQKLTVEAEPPNCQKLTPQLSKIDSQLSKIDSGNKEYQGREEESTRERVPSAPSERAPPQSRGAPQGHPDHQRLMDAYIDALGSRTPNGKKHLPAAGENGKAGKGLLADGWTVEDVLGCYWWLKSDPFWGGKLLTLTQVAKQIGEWDKAGRPAQWERRNGRAEKRIPTFEERRDQLLGRVPAGGSRGADPDGGDAGEPEAPDAAGFGGLGLGAWAGRPHPG